MIEPRPAIGQSLSNKAVEVLRRPLEANDARAHLAEGWESFLRTRERDDPDSAIRIVAECRMDDRWLSPEPEERPIGVPQLIAERRPPRP